MATNPIDILKRLDVKQNVTIRVIDEPTGTIIQEHIGHNAATNSLLTGIAHYLMGDGVFNQGSDTLLTWVPQYISLGTMGLTSQESETITVDDQEYIVPAALGYTPVAPSSATPEEKELNARLRFSEYINQAPGFGADGYDANSNNNREWFGLGRPYTLKPDALAQDFYDAGDVGYELSNTPIDGKNGIISVTIYNGDINQDIHDPSVDRSVLPTSAYDYATAFTQGNTGDGEKKEFTIEYHFTSIKYVRLNGVETTAYNVNTATNSITFHTAPAAGVDISISYNSVPVLLIPEGTFYSGRLAVIYAVESTDAANCELIKAKIGSKGGIVPQTLRSKITYRNLVPEIQSEVPNTLDVVFSAMISTGALKEFRGDRDYIYITEAGLWAKPEYNESGDNGMLAGYRIMPTDDELTDLAMQQSFSGDGTTTAFGFDETATEIISVTISGGAEIPPYSLDTEHNKIVFDYAPPSGTDNITVIYKTDNITGSWKDMTIEANRQKVQQSIIRIGVNQVAQVIWKIQLGGLEQLNGLRYLYPAQYPEEVWEIVK